MIGAYGTVGARLVERGYAAIPIMPNTKRPGELKRGEWVGKTNWREEYTRRLPSRFEIQVWSNSDAGVCVVCGPASKNLIGVDIDTDNPIIRNAILSALPPTTVSKRGQKGDTRFFIGPDILKSKSWNLPYEDRRMVGGKLAKYRACDLIGPGRQTVLPPSIHPDTGTPYVWTGPDALEDLNPDDLPELTPEHIKAIDAALAAHGYEIEAEPEPRDNQTEFGSSESDSPHRRLNDDALARLDSWVPGLGLYRCKRTVNGFEAVATWRGSNQGNRIEKRKLNLKVARQGIVDFGDGPRNYTPLNLWMAASDCDLDTAFRGLSDALGWNDSHVSFDLPVTVKSEPEPEATGTEIAVIEDESTELAEKTEAPKAARIDAGLEALTHCKGVIGQIVDWIEATSRRPNRVLALGAAVTVIGTLIGRRVCGPTRSATHLYVVGLAPTGSGKQAPLDAITRLMRSVKAGNLIGPSEFISMPAVINMLARQPLTICAQDEFGSFLKRINSRKASGFESGISKIFRSAWGISFGEYMTPEWAGRPAAPISCPAMSVFGMSTPEEFYEALQSSDLSNGFLNRFLVIRSERTAAVVPQLEPGKVPEQIVDALGEIFRWGQPEDNPLATVRLCDSNFNPDPVKVPWANTAASDFYAGLEHEVEMLIENGRNVDEFVGRTAEIAIRLATIRAVGRWGSNGPMVDLSDIQWGRDLALHCGLALAKEAKEHMAENDRQAWSNRILAVIKKKGSATPRIIQQHVRNALKGAEIKDILESLCEGGAIEKMMGQKSGKVMATGYRYTGE